MSERYLKRIVDGVLEDYLQALGAVLIVGPKWCGKTTTAEQQAKSVIKLQDPDRGFGYRETAKVKPSLLLAGENPRLIDEWQDAPTLWDAVRTTVDSRLEDGLFILTGSTVVDGKKIQHSGTGRIGRLEMSPMSLFESQESNGTISLRELFDNPERELDGAVSSLTIEELIFAACRGGWPGSLRRKRDKDKLLLPRMYLDSVCESDMSRVDDVKRDPKLVRAILRSYARNVSTIAKGTNILADVVASRESLSMGTLTSYIGALEKLFVVEDLDAWCPAIRSATVIRSGKKREFSDPSIAVAAMGLSPESFYHDLKTFGFIYECLCVRDLRAYSLALGGSLSYYRDRYGLEADIVLHLADGRYALVECKLGSNEIDSGANHLLEIRRLIREKNKTEHQCPLREPDVMMVLTGGEFGYTRSDGVHVVPIGCLKP